MVEALKQVSSFGGPQALDPQVDQAVCPRCGSSKVYNNGHRYAYGLTIQRFKCSNSKCGHRFSEKGTFTLNIERYNTATNQISALKVKNLVTTQTIEKVCAGDNNLVIYAWKQKKKGNSDTTIKLRLTKLKGLQKYGGNLNDPNTIDTILATEDFTKSKKSNLVKAYISYTKTMQITWTPPKVSYQPKQIFMPTKEELNTLIHAANKRLATFLQTALTTGARSGEIGKLKWTDINSEENTISINDAEKGSRNRTIKVPEKTLTMINSLPKKYAPYIFNPNVDSSRTTLCYLKRRVATSQNNPRLLQIHFHTFRHYFATEKLRQTKMLTHVQYLLGHKSIINTERYVHLVDYIGDKYFSAIATTPKEKATLIEDGWEYVTIDPDGTQYYRKPR